jgi:hypothetical protein
MMLPTVHLNGTSKNELEKQALEAAEALAASLDALYRMTPHDRDYYVQTPQAGQLARDEHQKRCHVVLEVLEDVQALQRALADDQCDAYGKTKEAQP